jgi:PKD repeat protein
MSKKLMFPVNLILIFLTISAGEMMLLAQASSHVVMTDNHGSPMISADVKAAAGGYNLWNVTAYYKAGEKLRVYCVPPLNWSDGSWDPPDDQVPVNHRHIWFEILDPYGKITEYNTAWTTQNPETLSALMIAMISVTNQSGAITTDNPQLFIGGITRVDGNYTVRVDPEMEPPIQYPPTPPEWLELKEESILIANFALSAGLYVGQPIIFNASSSAPFGGTIAACVWDFGDGNITSTNEPITVHVYDFPQTYNVTLTVIDSMDLNSSVFRMVHVMMPTTISISTNALGFVIYITGGLDDIYGRNLRNETVVLYYSLAGIGTWTPITSTTTDDLGRYNAAWVPSATGYYTIRGEWTGNATHLASNNTCTLSSLAYESQYVFTVESNSTISDLSFDPATQQLSFNATGPEGTKGYARIRIAKSLVTDPGNIRIYLDGNQREYSTTSTDDSWLLTFDYEHSVHRVTISLGVTSALFIDTPFGRAAIIGIVVVAVVVLTTFYILIKKRSKR